MTESTNLSASDILRIILSDKKLKKKLIEALSESLATKNDIVLILNEIKKLREDHNKDVTEILRRMDESQRRHAEEIEKIWIELRRLQGDMKRLQEEHSREMAEFRADMKRLQEEHSREMAELRREAEVERRKLWDAIKALREDFNKFGLKLDALGARWGILSEEAFRNALKGILEKRLNVKVKKWEAYDDEGLVYHAPALIEVDVVIANGVHTLIELKSHISKSDVATFIRKAEFYEKKTGVKPRLIMISPYIDKKAKEFAESREIKLYSSSYDDIVL